MLDNSCIQEVNIIIDYSGGDYYGGFFEKIPFENAIGLLTIDFSENERVFKFPRPTVKAFTVNGDIETEIVTIKETIELLGDVINSIDLDGVFGTGYILLKN